MATLPQPTDYGARPSLRSTRVDIPGQGELATGEALVNAIDSFNNVLNEKRAKEDRLNYALARNELQQADIAARELLKDDEDWASYDERYSEGYNTKRDEILGRYTLSPHDRAILSSESNLIHERGRVQMGDASRTVEIDEGMSRLNGGLDAARESIATEQDPETRNQILIGQLDAINAAEGNGYLTDVQAEQKRKLFAQDAAMASLINMDPEAREKLLEASLTWRNTGGAISVDDIRDGKGSGSVADFLPADVVKKLLKQTQNENEITNDRGRAQAVVDEAFELYPEDSKARMQHIRKETSDDPDVRVTAESMGNTRNLEERNYATQERQEILRTEGAKFEAGGYTYDDVPPEDLAKLSPAERNQLAEYDKKLRNAHGFADVNNWHEEQRDDDGALVRPSYSTWADMTLAEKAEQDLDLPMWKNNFTQGMWKAFQDEQFKIENGKAPRDDSVQTNDQILQSVVVGGGFLPQTGRSDNENAAYQRLRARFADDIRILQETKHGGTKAPYEERKNALLLILSEQAWQRDAGLFGADQHIMPFTGEAQAEPIFLMTPVELKAGYIPIDVVRAQVTTVQVGDTTIEMTWEQRLKNLAMERLNGREATQKDIENAYFAIRAGMSDAEVMRRLAGKGDE